MDIIEVDDDLAIKTCSMYNYKYAVITPDDLRDSPNSNDKISRRLEWKNFLSTGDHWTEIDFLREKLQT